MSDDISTAVSPDGDGDDYANYRNPPQYGKVPSVGCAVLHQDKTGNTIPCPGYPLCSKAPGGPAEPLPQPECAQCHQFGPGVVQDAVSQLKQRITEDRDWTSVMVDASELSVLITALERHHSH